MSARFVSQSIRVPNLSNARSRDAAASVIEEMEIDAKEQQAAEALCELSCSPPISLLFQPSLTGKVVVSPGSSLGYSSYPEVHGHLNHNYSDRINMSLHEPSSIDEGIEIDNERSGYIKHLKSSTEIFQCTWPGCEWSTKSSSEIERHIHQEHQCGSDSEEELFYYTSKRVAVDDVTRAFTQLHASSPPQKKGTSAKAVADHDYLLKAIHSSAPQTIPRRPLHAPAHNSYQADGGSSHSPASVSPLSRSWQSSQVNATSPTSMLSASPGHKRSRSEVKKCRKVYGMERRDEWCTQCKWKKACTRFID